MINTVKQTIQSYYPEQYLFLEFLRTGGWSERQRDEYRTRWELRIDNLVFEVDHTRANTQNDQIQAEQVFIRILRPSYRNPRLTVTGAGLRLLTREPSEIHAQIDELMRRTYHTPQMRGREHHVLI